LLTIPNPRAEPTEDAVSISIAREEFRFWQEIEFTRSIDTHPTFGLLAPFEAERQEFREIFRPFSFQPVSIALGGRLLFTGTLMGVEPRLSPESRTVAVSGYSRAAVLQDSDIPANLVPLQTEGLTLRHIAERIAGEFGLDVIMTSVDNGKFRKIRPEIDSKAQSFLMRLSQQRGFVLSSDERGDLLIWRSVAAGKPVARLREGASPVVSVTATFNPQDYCSEITGFIPARGGRIGSRYTVKNPHMPAGVLRTKVERLEDLERGDAPAAVNAKLGRMFGNMVAYTVNVPTWRDPQGDLWKPNTTVTLLAPDAMVYRETELLVRDVTLRQTGEEQMGSLGLVLPGAFSAHVPTRFPWDE
jgi:prophage tail gpP-like protein